MDNHIHERPEMDIERRRKSPEMHYEIDEVAFIGRTLGEYRQQFDLDLDSLAGRTILDCPSGTCSFVAEQTEHGYTAVGADILYDQSPAKLAQIAATDVELATNALHEVDDLYRWEFYKDVPDLRRYRERAASLFLRDYARRGERYIQETLPDLSFQDDAFDLVLSGHFLFLYDDRLPMAFHLESIRELSRVGTQLRIFPLHGFDAEESSLVEPVVNTLRTEGYEVRIRNVPFEFQRGANTMLVVE